jgi:hypothetical protein
MAQGPNMSVVRIVFLARYRIPHACVTMQFDHYLKGIDQTVIATTVPKEELWPIFERHGIDTKNLYYINDQEIYDRYPEVNHWVFADDYRGWWLRQQAIKLAYLDYLDYDVALMHDPDTFMVEPYCCWENNQLNMLVLPNTTHDSYQGVMESVLGISRQTQHCFVTELVAVVKQDWTTLKNTLENRYQQAFLDAIIDHVPGMPTVPPWGTGNLIKWFSEYEFLGNWAMTQRPINFVEQRRFEYDSLDKIKNFTPEYNCFADAVPDLSMSLQMDWERGCVVNFDYYVNLIQGVITP